MGGASAAGVRTEASPNSVARRAVGSDKAGAAVAVRIMPRADSDSSSASPGACSCGPDGDGDPGDDERSCADDGRDCGDGGSGSGCARSSSHAGAGSQASSCGGHTATHTATGLRWAASPTAGLTCCVGGAVLRIGVGRREASPSRAAARAAA